MEWLIFALGYFDFAFGINWAQSAVKDRLINASAFNHTEIFLKSLYADEHNCMDEELDIELRIIEELISSGYSKQIMPNKNGSDIVLEIHISDIPHISEIGSFFEVDLFYSEVWEDRRLAYAHKSHLPSSRCVKNMTLDVDYLQRLWTPNVCIVNSKSAVIHASPSENVFVILYPNGRIWKNCRMLVRAPCSIDLRNFPFDSQTCSLLFESYSYNSQKVRLQWMEEPITLMKEHMELNDFKLVDYRAEKLGVQYPNGHWDQLKATFVFERRYGFFIWQAFLPSYMTVGVAYITFWMDPRELCTRATLSISAFLAICLQFGNVQQNQPRVSYIKAMDVWMLASILFMFGALVELAIISYVSRRRERILTEKDSPRSIKARKNSREYFERLLNERHRENSLNENGVLTSSITEADKSDKNLSVNGWSVTMSEKRKNYKKRRSPLSPASVDKIFLYLYPPTFLAFNIFYWWFYLSHGKM